MYNYANLAAERSEAPYVFVCTVPPKRYGILRFQLEWYRNVKIGEMISYATATGLFSTMVSLCRSRDQIENHEYGVGVLW